MLHQKIIKFNSTADKQNLCIIKKGCARNIKKSMETFLDGNGCKNLYHTANTNKAANDGYMEFE